MMGLQQISLRNFILLSCAAFTLASRSFVIEFESFQSEANKNITEIFTVDMIQVGNRQILNGSVTFAIEIDQFELNLVWTIVRKNGQKRKMIDITVDGCNFLATGQSQGNQLAVLVMKVIRSSVLYVPTSCPIKKGLEIVVNKVYIDSENFPPYLPELDFEAKFIMTHKKVIGYKMMALGAIISKEKKKLLNKPL